MVTPPTMVGPENRTKTIWTTIDTIWWRLVLPPLKLVNAHTDDDRYDIVAIDAAGESLIGPLRSAMVGGCSIASMYATRLRSANELLWYHRRL